MEGHPFRDAPARKLPSTKIAASSSRWKNFLAIGGFALVWNTICGVIFVGGVAGGETFLIVFMSIFLLVGLGLLGLATHAFLAIFNPTIELHVSSALPALGDTLDVRWHVVGNARRIRTLKVELVGLEAATYVRGTDTTTDTHVFVRHRIAHTDSKLEIADGAGSAPIPAGAVPSFVAKHNKIVWAIKIEGEIPRWPDLDDEFLLEVVANPHHRKQREAA